MDKPAVVEALFGSERFQARMAPLVRLHMAARGEAPDIATLHEWARRRDAGDSSESLLQGLGQSAQATSETLARVDSGAGRVEVESRVQVALMYLALLRRKPDPEGLGFWSGRIAQGTPLREVLLTFMDMPEYRDVPDAD